MIHEKLETNNRMNEIKKEIQKVKDLYIYIKRVTGRFSSIKKKKLNL